MSEKMKKSAMVPSDKRQRSILKEMTPALQVVAAELHAKRGVASQGMVAVYYDMGETIAEIVKDEAKYGTKCVEQLADYLDIPGGATRLYALQSLASEFKREFVVGETEMPLGNGQFLTVSHWTALAQIKEPDEQERMLKRTRAESLTANDLEAEIRGGAAKTRNVRAGGRKPKVPSSPMAGLHKTGGLAQKMVNFGPVANTAVFEPLLDLAPDKVTKELVARLKETRRNLSAAQKVQEAAIEKIDKIIERSEKVLSQKAEEAADAKAETKAEKKSEKKAKKGKKAA